MYTSPDEARSDLFLAAAVYVFGDLVLNLLLEILGLNRFAPIVYFQVLVVPLLITVAVPAMLIRFRKERIADYGWDGSLPAFAQGVVAAAPIVVVSVGTALLRGGGGLGMPVVDVFLGGSALFAVGRFLSVVGLVLLGVYCTVKARDAFRVDPKYLTTAFTEIAKWVALVGAVATTLLLLTFLTRGVGLVGGVEIALMPAAVAAAGFLVHRQLRTSQLTSRAIMLTPTILFAVGIGLLQFEAMAFVAGLWRGAMYAGVGLIAGALLESRRSALAPIGLGVAVAALSIL